MKAFLLTLFFIPVLAFSLDFSADFEIDENSASIPLGRSVSFKLKLKNIADNFIISKSQLLDSSLEGYFYFLSLNKILRDNDQREVLISGTGIFRKVIPPSHSILWTYNDMGITVKFFNLKFTKGEKKEISILMPKYLDSTYSYKKLLIIFSLIIISLAFFLIGMIFWKKRNVKKLSQESKMAAFSVFEGPYHRGHLEDIWNQRDKWKSYFQEDFISKLHDDLKDIIYKKEWSQEDLENVSQRFKSIAGKIEHEL